MGQEANQNSANQREIEPEIGLSTHASGGAVLGSGTDLELKDIEHDEATAATTEKVAKEVAKEEWMIATEVRQY